MLTFPRLSRDKNGIWEPLSSQSVGFRGTSSGGEGNTSKEQVERAVRGKGERLRLAVWGRRQSRTSKTQARGAEARQG